jgi:hypothetical protein
MNGLRLFGRFFAVDLWRILTELSFASSLFLGTASLLIPFFSFFSNTDTDSVSSGFVTAQSMVLPFVAPFLAALPFSVMMKIERETKFSELLKIRRGGKSYALSRFVTVGISGGLALLLPEILLLIVSIAFKYTESIADFDRIGYTLALAFPFGFVFAVAAFTLTYVTKSKVLALCAPEVVYLLLTYGFPYLNLGDFVPPFAVSPYIFGTADLRYIMVMFSAMLIICLAVTIIFENFTVKET